MSQSTSLVVLCVLTAEVLNHGINAAELMSPIIPLFSNSTTSVWIASVQSSEPHYFSFGNITCGASYCHIVCDVLHGCDTLNVYVTSPLTTLVIECLKDTACTGATIYANVSKSVQLTCYSAMHTGYSRSCRWLNLYASRVQNDVNIVCNGSYECLGANFDASNIGNSLNVTCDGIDSCKEADIYCPKDALCNIDCLAPQSSCSNTQFHIASHSDHKLNLDCPASSSLSCNGADFVCEDTKVTTPFIFNEGAWECGNYRCCPYGNGNITCYPGVACQIDCDVQPCNNKDINASLATSLTLDCGVNRCQNAQIECPKGPNTTCNIRCPSIYSCELAYVQAGELLSAASPSSTELDIQCTAVTSCSQTVIDASAAYSVQLTCASSNPLNQYLYGACEFLKLYASDVTNATVICNNDYDCYGTYMYFENAGDVSLRISAYRAAVNATIEAANVQNGVNIVCNGTFACESANFNGSHIGNSLNVTCDGSNGCTQADIHCPKDASCIIRCSGDLNTHSCELSNVYASTSEQLSLECSGENGCLSSSIYCPNTGSCNIDCLAFDACSEMTTEIASKAYDKLNLNCDDPWYGCDYDETPRIHCIDSDEGAKLVWSSYYQSVVCYGDCCPPNILHPARHDSSARNASGNPSNHPLFTTDYKLIPSRNPTKSPLLSTVDNTINDNNALGNASDNDHSGLVTVIVIISVLLLFGFVVSAIYFRILHNQINALNQFTESWNNSSNPTASDVIANDDNDGIDVEYADKGINDYGANETAGNINAKEIMDGSAMMTRGKDEVAENVNEEGSDDNEDLWAQSKEGNVVDVTKTMSL
eukprot:4097_1